MSKTPTNTPKSPVRDNLTATTQDGKIDLTEEELARVTGGAIDSFRGAAPGIQLNTWKLDILKNDPKT